MSSPRHLHQPSAPVSRGPWGVRWLSKRRQTSLPAEPSIQVDPSLMGRGDPTQPGMPLPLPSEPAPSSGRAGRWALVFAAMSLAGAAGTWAVSSGPLQGWVEQAGGIQSAAPTAQLTGRVVERTTLVERAVERTTSAAAVRAPEPVPSVPAPPASAAPAASPAPVAPAPTEEAAEASSSQGGRSGSDLPEADGAAGQADLWAQDAYHLRRRGELDQAAALYQRVLDAHPHHAPALAGMAQVQLERGRGRRAVALAMRAMRSRPGVAGYRLVLGDALVLHGDPHGARAAYAKALQLGDTRAAQRLDQVPIDKGPAVQAHGLTGQEPEPSAGGDPYLPWHKREP